MYGPLSAAAAAINSNPSPAAFLEQLVQRVATAVTQQLWKT